jgi:hypothetical protein
MNTTPTRGPGDAHAFDARLRAIHAEAVAATPARIRLQLRPRRSGAASGARRGWSMAAAFAIALVAAGLLWQRPASVAPVVPAAGGPAVVVAPGPTTDAAPDTADFDEAYAALDESPDLYLWLASSDASAMLDGALLDGTLPTNPSRNDAL